MSTTKVILAPSAICLLLIHISPSETSLLGEAIKKLIREKKKETDKGDRANQRAQGSYIQRQVLQLPM